MPRVPSPPALTAPPRRRRLLLLDNHHINLIIVRQGTHRPRRRCARWRRRLDNRHRRAATPPHLDRLRPRISVAAPSPTRPPRVARAETHHAAGAHGALAAVVAVAAAVVAEHDGRAAVEDGVDEVEHQEEGGDSAEDNTGDSAGRGPAGLAVRRGDCDERRAGLAGLDLGDEQGDWGCVL